MPTHIDTTIDSTLHHLLSLVQALLEVARLLTRRHLGTSLGKHKLGYLLANIVSNTVSSPESPRTNNRILKTEDERHICIVSDRLLNSFERFWLVTLPHMNDISMSTYKELQSC